MTGSNVSTHSDFETVSFDEQPFKWLAYTLFAAISVPLGVIGFTGVVYGFVFSTFITIAVLVITALVSCGVLFALNTDFEQ